jgi:RNA polymerase sigma factor (TIGR02999 family)
MVDHLGEEDRSVEWYDAALMSQVTELLHAIAAGKPQAADQLIPLVYGELRRLAASRLAREGPSHTLNATALVNEAYLRLLGPDQKLDFDNRGHFFGAAAEAMRRILVESARRKHAQKRGGRLKRQTLEPGQVLVNDDNSSDELLALDEALVKLASEDAGKAELVKLRYFAGLTLSEAAQVLGISRTTADRWWAYAKAYLLHELTGGQ